MLIISASNVKKTKKDSQSLVIARTLKNLLDDGKKKTEILDLRKYTLTPCIMCEKCVKTGKCVRGDDFNKIAKKILQHRNIVIVCPHYAGIPSKLMMFLEKLQEISYLKQCSRQKDAYPLKNAFSAVIAHGGMTDNYDELYAKNVITPLGNALKAVGFEYLNDSITLSLTVGVKQYFEKRDKRSVCFLKESDTEKINCILKELVTAIKNRREQ